MRKFLEVDPSELKDNVFRRIGQEWMLISAGKEGACNTMTASWGGLGQLWNVPVAFAFVRPSRYTYGLMEDERFFSLAFPGMNYRRAMQLCGSHSGRDGDKFALAGLTPRFDAAAPYPEEAELVLICRKLYYQDLDAAHFLDPAIAANYKNGDYHRMYVGEITKVLQAAR